MSSTYKDIQRLTGFSLSTISKYFNDGNVRASTKESIEAAVKQLDFRINDLARGLKSRRSMAVGLLIPELNSIFHTTIMRHVGHFLRQRGYSCLVSDCNADKSVERDALNFLIDKMVDGIITIPLDASGRHLELARSRNIPVVLIDRKTSSFQTDTVVVDNFIAGKKAGNLFIECGHFHTAIISGPSSIYTMSERCRGFVKTFEKRGSVAEVNVVETDFSIDGGYQAAKHLFYTQKHITAIFCSNYELTIGTLTTMNELGIKYPDDISIIGFDNMELSRVLKPTLTLIEQPLLQLAQSAAGLLLQRMESDTNHEIKTITLQTNLRKGDSVVDLCK